MKKIASCLIFSLLLNSFTPFLAVLVPVHASEKTRITESSSKKALFEAQEKNFRVEFGDKNKQTQPKVRFEAMPIVYEDLPTEATPSAEVKKSLKKRPFFVKAKEWVKNLIGRPEKMGIEFSLVEAGVVENQSQPSTPSTSEVKEAKTIKPRDDTLSPLQQSLLENLQSQLKEIAKESEKISKTTEDLKKEVKDLVSQTKEVYGKTQLTKENNQDTINNIEVTNGVDLKYQIIEGKGVKEEIVVKENANFKNDCLGFLSTSEVKSADTSEVKLPCSLPQNTFTFELKLDPNVQIHQSLTGIENQPSGVYYFTDQYGRYLAHFLPPFAKDVKNNRTNEVKMTIAANSSTSEVKSADTSEVSLGGYLLTLTVSLDWLLSPDRTYPIIIDPSIVHDTEVEFDTADSLNRVESISGPIVQTPYHELSTDQYTVGLYHLNNVWTDSSGLANDLTATNTPTFTTSSVVGSHAGSFAAASSQYATQAYDADFDFGTASFSVEAWFKHDTISAADYLISRYDTDQGFKIYMDASGDLCFDIDDDATWGPDDSACTSAVDYDDNSWHHLAGVKDAAAAIRLYIDGKEVASKVVLTATATLTSNSAPFTLASDEPTNGSYWDGQIDEVRVLKRALTPEEIKADSQRRPYGIYTSDVLDLTSQVSSLDSLQWTENGVKTADGETLYSSTNLVAQWNFNETSNTTANNDAEGTSCGGTPANCDGTVTNMTTTGQDAAPGDGWTADNKRWGAGALMFDATDGYVSVTDNNSLDLTTFTLEAWFNVNTNKNYNTLFSKGNDAQENYELILTSAGAGYAIYWTDTSRTIGTTTNLNIIPGNWYHLVEVFDGSSLKLYLNGVLKETDTNFTKTPQTNAINLLIGNESGVAGRYFDGIIDSARIYSRALTANEILTNYNAANIEFQTRTSNDNSTWEAWKPTTSESQLASMDSDAANWSYDSTNPTSGGLTKSDESTVKYEGSGSLKVEQGAPQVNGSYTTALLHLDETNGDLTTGGYEDVFDESDGSQNDGEFEGTGFDSNVVDGVFGKARVFNGTDNYISISDNGSALDLLAGEIISVSFWIKDLGVGSNENIISKNSSYLVRWSNTVTGAIEGCDTVAGTCATSNSTLDDGQWHYIFYLLNDATNLMTLWVDGVAQADTGTVTPAGNQTTAIFIGAGNSTFCSSTIDEFHLIKGVALTNEEIAEDYRRGRDHYLSKTISSADLSSKTKLPFYVAADRPGTYLEATIGESSYANYEPDANTVGFWHLEEQTGSGSYLQDSSTSNNNDATPTNTYFVQGKIGKGRLFDGSGDYLNVADSASIDITSGTIEGWFYPTACAANDKLIIRDDGSVNRFWQIQLTNTSCNVQFIGAAPTEWGYNITSSGTLTLNTWNHVAVTFSATTDTAYMYFNGALVGSDTAAGDMATGAQAIEIAGDASSAGDSWNGMIDEIRILDTAKTADQIRQTYEVGLRSHQITVDFASSPSAVDIKGTSEVNALTDTSFVITDDNMIDDVFVGDKVLVKERYSTIDASTTYLAQGMVSAVDTGTRTITVSSWSGTVPNPGTGVCGGSNTHCYTTKATVFKWQREFFDLTGSLSTHRDAITNLTFRLTDGSEGRTLYLDDIESGGAYLTAPSATSNITSTKNRYFQYRAVISSYDPAVTPYLSAVTLNYTTGPTNDLLMRHGKWFSSGVKQSFWWAQ